MRRGVAVGMGCAMLLAGVSVTHARGERGLTGDELRAEIAANKAMRAYVARNGEPDLAETHFLADEPPWDDHEVTLYYLGARREIAFARAYILGRPEVEIQRYSRPLSDAQVAALTARMKARAVPPAEAAAPPEQMANLAPDERAERAAQRAEDAAGRVEAAASSAEYAADRAEAIAEKAVSAARPARKK